MSYIDNLLARGFLQECGTAGRVCYEIKSGVEVDFNSKNALKFALRDALIRCDTVECNGLTRLEYDVESYSNLSSILPSIDDSALLSIFASVMKTVTDIESHGLLHLECTPVSLERIYVFGSAMSVRLIHLPITQERDPERRTHFTQSLLDSMRLALSKVTSSNTPIMNTLREAVCDPSTTIERLCDIILTQSGAKPAPVVQPAAPVETRSVPQSTPTYGTEPFTASLTSQQAGFTGYSEPSYNQPVSTAQQSTRREETGDGDESPTCIIDASFSTVDYLLVLRGNRINQNGVPISEPVEIKIGTSQVVIGRSSEGTNFRISVSPNVSRVHCRIYCEPGRKPGQFNFFIEDIGIQSDGTKGTRNGTWHYGLRKKRLKYGSPMKLRIGDKIAIADVLFTVEKPN